MVVVPPVAAAMVPLTKSSAVVVPIMGESMCVCTSTPPGRTYLPWQSTRSTDSGRVALSWPTAVTLPFSTSTSARVVSVEETTVPPVRSFAFICNVPFPGVRSLVLLVDAESHGQGFAPALPLGDDAVGVRAAVGGEVEDAFPVGLGHLHIGADHNDFVAFAGGLGQDFAAGRHQCRSPDHVV